MSVAARVSCVIVHHRQPESLATTIDALLANGVAADDILVVDNGGGEAVAVIDGVGVLGVPNHGYAAAANAGVAALAERGVLHPLVLVASHEAVAGDHALELLACALEDERVAAAGPTLLNADAAGRAVWSTGGMLTAVLKRPRHIVSTRSTGAPVSRAWLDGAFVLYRSALLQRMPFDEEYFLYFEETDLHARLVEAGHRVVWVPEASAAQRSSGVPPWLLGRNLFLFQAKRFSPWRGRLGVLLEAARTVARALLRPRGRASDARAVLAGWRAGERAATHPRDTERHGPAVVTDGRSYRNA